MTTYKDYYQVLGVERSASDEQIKAAYRKLARKHHPDLHQGEDKKAAEERFKEINEAYEVLGDPEKRSKYDQLGTGFRHGQEWQPPPGSNGYHYYTWSDLDGSDPFAGSGFSDFFEILFGRGGRQGFSGFSARGQDVEAKLSLTLEEAFHGTEKNIHLNSGKTLGVKIPAGTKDGAKIRLKGQGGAGINHNQPGDLYLKVKLHPHSRFRIKGYDLETKLEIAPEQAVLGDKVSLSTLDGTVLLTIPPKARAGQKLRLKGKGWPKNDKARGDLYVKLEINLPNQLDPAEIELYKKIRTIKQGGEP